MAIETPNLPKFPLQITSYRVFQLSLFHYIGESNSNEGVEEETGGQPLHEEGQDNERVEEPKNHEEATASIPCTEISSDFNSKYCQLSEYYNYYIFVYR